MGLSSVGGSERGGDGLWEGRGGLRGRQARAGVLGFSAVRVAASYLGAEFLID